MRDALDRERKPGETRGRTQCREPGIDEALRIAGLDDAACDKAARRRGTNAQRTGDTIDEAIVERANAQLHTRTLVVTSDSETWQIPE